MKSFAPVVDGGVGGGVGGGVVAGVAGVCKEGELSIVVLVGEAGGVIAGDVVALVADAAALIDKASPKSFKLVPISRGSCPTTYNILRFLLLLVALSYFM